MKPYPGNERVIMCVTEAGYPPTHHVDDCGCPYVEWAGLPHEVFLKALEVAGAEILGCEIPWAPTDCVQLALEGCDEGRFRAS